MKRNFFLRVSDPFLLSIWYVQKSEWRPWPVLLRLLLALKASSFVSPRTPMGRRPSGLRKKLRSANELFN